MNTHAFSAIFGMPPGMAPQELAGSPMAGTEAVTPGFQGGFAQLLHTQNATSTIMQQLKTVLPVEEFAQLEAQVDGGNLLPLAEIIATLGQQQAAAGQGGNGQQLPPLAQIVAMMRHQQPGEGQPLVAPEETTSGQQPPGEGDLLAAIMDKPEVEGAPLTPVIEGDPTDTQTAELSVPLPPIMEPFKLTQADGEGLPTTATEAVTETLQKRPVPYSAQAARLMAMVEKLDASLAGEAVNKASLMESVESEADSILLKLGQEGFKPAETLAGQAAQIPPALGVMRRLFGATEAGGMAAMGAAQVVTPQQPIQANSTTFAAPLPIDIHPGHKGWDQAMGERMMWMIGNRVQAAEVRITPPHLGPIDIRISIQNDQASVSFLAQHGVVREALEASIPRLREMLGENNLQLANVDVGQREAGEQRNAAGFFFGHGSNPGYDEAGLMDEGEAVVPEGEGRYYQSDGLLDAFA
jgi:hypothetical protein